MLFAAFGMVVGVAIAHLSNDPLIFVVGVLHAFLASVSFLLFLVVFGFELGIRCVVEPMCGTRAQVSVPRSWSRYCRSQFRRFWDWTLQRGEYSVELVDLESGPDPRPRYSRDADDSPTIGFPYREPRVIVTETGLPGDWDRPDNVQPIRRALAEMQAEGVAGGTREDTENEASASRGTQTNVLDGGRFPRDERMPGGMAPVRFWWLLLDEMRQQELATVERENRRRSW